MNIKLYLSGNVNATAIHNPTPALLDRIDRMIDGGTAGRLILYSTDGISWHANSADCHGNADRIRRINPAHIIAYDLFGAEI